MRDSQKDLQIETLKAYYDNLALAYLDWLNEAIETTQNTERGVALGAAAVAFMELFHIELKDEN